MTALAEYGDGREAHECIFVACLCYLEYEASANELHKAQSAIDLREGEAEVKHHAPEEAETSTDAAD